MTISTPTPDEVQKWEIRRRDALVASDVDALETLLSPTLQYVHSTAARDTRDSYLQKVASGLLRYQSLEFSDLQVQCAPSAVVVTGQMDAVVLKHGEPKVVRSVFMTVWWPEGGEWRLRAHQGTALPI